MPYAHDTIQKKVHEESKYYKIVYNRPSIIPSYQVNAAAYSYNTRVSTEKNIFPCSHSKIGVSDISKSPAYNSNNIQ